MVSSKTVEVDLDLKLRSDFNRNFTNHEQTLYGFKKKEHKRQFIEILKMFKNNINSPEQPILQYQSLATETIRPHSLYFYVVTIVGYCYSPTVKGLKCCEVSLLEVAQT